MAFEPLSKKNWGKFEELFGAKGACGNCWCMYFRLSKADFTEGKVNDGNKEAMKALVWAGIVQGLSTPFLMLALMRMTNNHKIMGRWVNTRAMNVLGWLTAAAIFLASAGLVISWL